MSDTDITGTELQSDDDEVVEREKSDHVGVQILFKYKEPYREFTFFDAYLDTAAGPDSVTYTKVSFDGKKKTQRC